MFVTSLNAAPIDLEGIAEPHRSTVTAIIDFARQGLCTDAQALLMIGRIRAVAGVEVRGVLTFDPVGSATPTGLGMGGAAPGSRG